MLSNREDEKSRSKLAQIWHLTNHIIGSTSEIDSAQNIINKILNDDFNINSKVTIASRWPKDKINLKGCTALHLLHGAHRNINIITHFLERGIDFTAKNENGQTALHMAITYNLHYTTLHFDISLIESVLRAHVKSQNFTNPRDNYGISHLHGACFTNHVEAATLFLENGASVDEAVNIDAPKFAGYAPLHFAAELHSLEVTQMLLHRGANINVKDAKGLTALDIVVRRRLDKFEDLSRRGIHTDEEYGKNVRKKFSDSEKIIQLLLKHHCLLTVGLSIFQVACHLRDLTIAERYLDKVVDIDQAVSMESPDRPGDTALHFAAENCIQAVKMLVMRGAKMDIENAVGLTPLDVCVNRYKIEDLCNVLSCDDNWNSACITDEKTKLIDFIRSMSELEQFKLFLHIIDMETSAVSKDSSIFPGSTILHLAVIFSTKTVGFESEDKIYDDKIVKVCLGKELDINVQNTRGQTPIHLAFRLCQKNIVNLLLDHLGEASEVTNLTDEDGLSYLLIACAMKDTSLVEKLLKTSDVEEFYKGEKILDEYIVPGSTALHVAVANNSPTVAQMLLEEGADLFAINANNMTPIHYILQIEAESSRGMAKILFDALFENLEDHEVYEVGLGYLHIACYSGDLDAVKRLLKFGSDVNAPISCDNLPDNYRLNRILKDLAKYSTFTPLHLSELMHVEGVADVLLRHGADLFAKVYDDTSIYWSFPLEYKNITRIFSHVLWEENVLQKRMEERFGLTKLHIACHMKNEEAIKSALNMGIDVNAQVDAGSEIFAGCTPLHLLMTISNCQNKIAQNAIEFAIESMVRLLLDHGADVTIANAKKETPLHVFFYKRRHFNDDLRCRDLLLNAHKNFNNNSVNDKGLSHFHLACHWHRVEVVQQFLQQCSVDVNQPIDYFAGFNGGCTPLHLVLDHNITEPNYDWKSVLQIVDMLLDHGADVNAKDVRGETPLHKPAAFRSPQMSIFNKLIRHGADTKSESVIGRTALDKHITFVIYTDEYISILKKYDYPIYSWNNLTGQGYLGKIFASFRTNMTENANFRNLIESLDAQTIDEMGRTVIHNSVAVSSLACVDIEYYMYAFKIFIQRGIDIDHQDQSGQTALHYAARMENRNGTKALLAHGADFNITDSTGRSALSYLIEYHERDAGIGFFTEAIDRINLHLKKLQYLRLEVSLLNHNLAVDIQFEDEEDETDISQLFYTQVEMAKTVDVGVGSLTLSDFLNETGGITLYPYLLISERTVINDFFKNIPEEEFSEVVGIIKLQYRKMTARLELIDPALSSLRKLMGFSVPGLCEHILRSLSNTDLKNMIKSVTFETRKRKRSESE